MLIPEPKKKEPTPPPPMPPQKDEPGKLSYDRGIIHLTTKFDNKEIMPIVKSIIEYNLMDRAPEEITLYINSGGGDPASCFHLIDVMKKSRIPVNTVGMGLVASCGILTLMAGAKRYITQNTQVMSHQGTFAFQGKEHEFRSRFEAVEDTARRVEVHYMKCCKKKLSYVKKHLLTTTDMWLSGEECVTHGVIDEIIQTY